MGVPAWRIEICAVPSVHGQLPGPPWHHAAEPKDRLANTLMQMLGIKIKTHAHSGTARSTSSSKAGPSLSTPLAVHRPWGSARPSGPNSLARSPFMTWTTPVLQMYTLFIRLKELHYGRHVSRRDSTTTSGRASPTHTLVHAWRRVFNSASRPRSTLSTSRYNIAPPVCLSY